MRILKKSNNIEPITLTATDLSSRVVLIKKSIIQPEFLRQIFPQSLYAKALGGVVAAGEVVDAEFACFVVGALRDFARDVGVRAELCGGVYVVLRAARTPRDASQWRIWLADEQWRSPQYIGNARTKLADGRLLDMFAKPHQRLNR